MLHENHPLPPPLRKQINARKKEYVHFVEKLIAEVQSAQGIEVERKSQGSSFYSFTRDD